ncbi:MAG: DegT/DnrJ/EryC1/StrS family aminotransferase [Niabella sp.]
MRTIQMVDTKTQYQKIKPEIDKAVIDVMESSAFINGPVVKEFADNLAAYLGAKHAIPCGNGTDALQIALMALGLKPGDEVITPSFTFIATTEVVALLGLTPVFVDVDKDTFCVDIADLERAITPRTKAIVPVHLYGHPANMEAIMAIAQKHDLYVVEDNAQSIGAEYTFSDGTTKKTGTIGHIGCTSFYPSKNLGAFGDGGAISTNDDALAERLRIVANHGQTKRYYHDVVGCNSRLDSVQAAVLNIKLRYLEEYNQARHEAAVYYNNAFSISENLATPRAASNVRHVYNQYTLIVEGADRDGLQQYLASKGVPSMLYYPLPGHRQKMFESFQVEGRELPVTDWLTDRVISLPMHSELDEEQLLHITGSVLEYVNK